MTIQGHFKDIHNNTIDVLIYKPGDLTVYNIDDYLDSTHHFVFNGDSPVTIKRECSDLFEPIISTSCQIKLISNIWCGDILFSNGIGDIIVRVNRTVGNDTQLMFVGYVTPLTFSQDINQKHNIIDINCKDILGCLTDKTLSTGTSYDTVSNNAILRSFQNVLKMLEIYNNETTTYTFPSEQYSTKLYMDSNVSTFKDLRISDSLWLGSSVDDEMTLEEILLEILKYTNSRIVSINGIDHFMISNNNQESQSSFYLCNTDTTVNLQETSDELPTDDISDEQVTMDDCYNLIGVKCELEKIDDVVIDPLKDSDLQSPYSNAQLYMTEYVLDPEDGEAGVANSGRQRIWANMVVSDVLPQQYNTSYIKDWSTLWMRNWYFRYVNNPNWKFYGPYTPATDSNHIYIRQYESLGVMNDLYNNDIIRNMGLYDFVPCNLYPMMLKYAHGSKINAVVRDEKPDLDWKNVLVIPCPETWMYYIEPNQRTTEEWAYNYINAQLAKYEQNPMVTYKNNTIVNYTPSDESITNYLIISGNLTLLPSCVFDEQTVPITGHTYRGISYDGSYQDIVYDYKRFVETYPYNYQAFYGQFRQAQGTEKDDKRWYYPKFWTKNFPNQEEKYVVHDINEPDVTGSRYESNCAHETGAPTYRNGILYMLSTEDMYSKMFGWGKTQIDKYNSTLINMDYVPVLMCKLRIGNKYLNEKQEDGQKYPEYEWTTDSNAVFSISVKPQVPENIEDEPKDFLIGQEYPITNTVTVAMNLGKTTGLAIPIKYDDQITGDIEFNIVGPYNAVIESTNHYYRHATWFRSEKSWSEQNAQVCVLNHVHSINITNFEIKAVSDNAKNSTFNEGDLLYYSEDNKKYNNPKDEINFKIVSGLTPKEAAQLNVANGISTSNPTAQDGYIYVPTIKPEETYVTTMYNLYSTPKKIVEYESTIGTNKVSDMYRTVYDNDLMEKLDISSFDSIIIGDELNLKFDRMKIKTRQI